MELLEETVRVADAVFDAAEAAGQSPAVVLEGLAYALACYARQHRVSGDGLHRVLTAAWVEVCERLPGFSIEVVAPGDLEAELRKVGGT